MPDQDQLTNYRCPACSGPLHYGSKTGKMECDYCGSSFTLQEIESFYNPPKEETQSEAREEPAEAASEEDQDTSEWDLRSAGSSWGEDADHVRAYSCPSCGAELIFDETTAATSCPYCGSPTVIPGQLGGSLRPDYIIPFKLNKKEATEALKKHYHGKILLPKAFRTDNHIREIKGIYVPFWLFDADVDADMAFHGTTTSTHREGDYRVTETSHYDVRRKGRLSFRKVPVDGSQKMPDDLMDSLEPYNYQELTDFATVYLPGYMADKYDVSTEEASKRADLRCKNTTAAEVRATASHYTTLTPVYQRMALHQGQAKYALLPVWLLTTKWKDQTYLFAMNGQTGKMVGNLPMDRSLFHRWFWSVALGASLVLSLLFSGPIGRMIAQWLS